MNHNLQDYAKQLSKDLYSNENLDTSREGATNNIYKCKFYNTMQKVEKTLEKISKRKIITLCGSTRFKEEFELANKKWTADGYIVLSVGVFGHMLSEDEKKVLFSEERKKDLDKLHLDKIDMSDAIYVVTRDGYIGESTQNEIDYARMKKIPVIFSGL